MDMDTAANFLSASILTMLGFIIIVMGVIVINNLIAKYWKDLGWFKSWATMHQEPPRFIDEPKTVDTTTESKVK